MMSTIKELKSNFSQQLELDLYPKVRNKTKDEWSEFLSEAESHKESLGRESDRLDNIYDNSGGRNSSIDDEIRSLSRSESITSDLIKVIDSVVRLMNKEKAEEEISRFESKNKVEFRFGKLNY